MSQACFDALLPGLQRLDRLLERAIAATNSHYGAVATEPYRGLSIHWRDVERLLHQQPGVPQVATDNVEEPLSVGLADDSRLMQLARQFALSAFDLDLILIGLAPDLDLRYGQLFAYLQEMLACPQPSVDLALNLLCMSAAEKLAGRDRIAPQAPLIQHQLLQLIPDPTQVQPPVLTYRLKLDDGIVRWLLGQRGVDSQLMTFCQWIEPIHALTKTQADDALVAPLVHLIEGVKTDGLPLVLHFSGNQPARKRRCAIAIARTFNLPLLVANLTTALETPDALTLRLNRLFRDARLQQAILYVDGLDALRDRQQHQIPYHHLLHQLSQPNSSLTILASTSTWIPHETRPNGILDVPFPLPNFHQRRTCWQNCATAAQIPLNETDLDALADRFRFTPDQIADTVAIARNQALWQAATQPPQRSDPSPTTSPVPPAADLFAAARAQSGQDLQALARKIEPRYGWSDIILPPDPLAQLQEICNQAKYRPIVYGQWGFDRKLSLGKGLNVLFSGPPGTGKTMAAEVIARELQLDLYKIDLSQVVNKYIGETEKNLDRIFAAAARANAILFFDEADTLFGKRSEVRDARDRYANLEIGYLLQKMEEYEGIAILATNLRQNLDEAFVRRLHFIVEFPFPDAAERRRIWQVTFPPETPLHSDIDFERLAANIKLAGGNIKNIALAAAFYAAQVGEPIQLSHLNQATRREHQKLGRSWSAAEWTT